MARISLRRLICVILANKGKIIQRSTYGFIRGGNWNNGANAGAFSVNLNNGVGNQNNNIGFRCASDIKSVG